MIVITKRKKIKLVDKCTIKVKNKNSLRKRVIIHGPLLFLLVEDRFE